MQQTRNRVKNGNKRKNIATHSISINPIKYNGKKSTPLNWMSLIFLYVADMAFAN